LRSGKPLITCTDSGGPTEFVVEGHNGFIADPNVGSLKNAMERCLNSLDYKSLSSAASLSIKDISWQRVVDALIEQLAPPVKPPFARKKVVSLSTYPIYPPKGGGQARVYYLCRELSKEFDVRTICLVDGALEPEIHEINEHFIVEYVPADKPYCEIDWNLYVTGGIPTTDVAMVAYHEQAPSFENAVRSAIATADAVIAEQPYTYILVKKFSSNQLRIYNSQNVELILKQQMFRDSAARDVVVAWTEQVERLACEDADLIVFCSEADKSSMERIYPSAKTKKSIIIENGAASETISYLSSAEHRGLRKRLLSGHKVGIFVGSWHQPNIEAIYDLDKIAARTPYILYLVVGTVGAFFKDSGKISSKNIVFTGLVTSEEKDLLLQLADFAVNPMSTGSGTNIKMFDYMASGLPLVSTEIGARGIDLPTGFVEVVKIEDFPEAIEKVAKMPRNIQKRMYVEARYDWRSVSARYIAEVRNLLQSEL